VRPPFRVVSPGAPSGPVRGCFHNAARGRPWTAHMRAAAGRAPVTIWQLARWSGPAASKKKPASYRTATTMRTGSAGKRSPGRHAHKPRRCLDRQSAQVSLQSFAGLWLVYRATLQPRVRRARRTRMRQDELAQRALVNPENKGNIVV